VSCTGSAAAHRSCAARACSRVWAAAVPLASSLLVPWLTSCRQQLDGSYCTLKGLRQQEAALAAEVGQQEAGHACSTGDLAGLSGLLKELAAKKVRTACSMHKGVRATSIMPCRIHHSGTRRRCLVCVCDAWAGGHGQAAGGAAGEAVQGARGHAARARAAGAARQHAAACGRQRCSGRAAPGQRQQGRQQQGCERRASRRGRAWRSSRRTLAAAGRGPGGAGRAVRAAARRHGGDAAGARCAGGAAAGWVVRS
jgi:hypothetical protein